MSRVVVVVLGASGTVGSGVVKRFLRAGNTTVVAPARGSVDKVFKAIGEEFRSNDSLLTPQANYGEKAGAETLAKWIEDNIPGGKVDHIFAVGGGMAPFANVSQITSDSLNDTVQTKIVSILSGAQALVPLLKDEETSTFTVVTGALGEYCFAARFSLTTIANAAVFGLTLALQAEAREQGKKYRINEFRIAAIILPDGVTEHPHMKIPGGQTSVLAELYDNRIVSSTARDQVIRVNNADVGLN
jgi:NAD(P)-dependent dehydrogenase (short-subunit alcohol dehydrogenase family)